MARARRGMGKSWLRFFLLGDSPLFLVLFMRRQQGEKVEAAVVFDCSGVVAKWLGSQKERLEKRLVAENAPENVAWKVALRFGSDVCTR